MNTPKNVPLLLTVIVKAILTEILEPQPVACFGPYMLEPEPIAPPAAYQATNADLAEQHVFFG